MRGLLHRCVLAAGRIGNPRCRFSPDPAVTCPPNPDPPVTSGFRIEEDRNGTEATHGRADHHPPRGVNGNQANNNAASAGAAYVFVPSGPRATFSTIGLGCKGSKTGVPALSNRQLPALGKSFMLDLANAPLATGGLLFFGFAPASLDLGPIGAPGCTVHAQLPFLSWTVYTDWFGKWPNPTPFPLPIDPNLVGAVFYNQFLLLDRGANQLGLIVSNGGKATIGY